MPTIAKLLHVKMPTDAELLRLAETLEYITARYYDTNRRSRRTGDELDHAADCYGMCQALLAEEIARIEAVTPAGLRAKARALRAWYGNTLDWPHKGYEPEYEEILARTLVADTLRLLGDDDAATKVA